MQLNELNPQTVYLLYHEQADTLFAYLEERVDASYGYLLGFEDMIAEIVGSNPYMSYGLSILLTKGFEVIGVLYEKK
jgi:hypothetical protein